MYKYVPRSSECSLVYIVCLCAVEGVLQVEGRGEREGSQYQAGTADCHEGTQ